MTFTSLKRTCLKHRRRIIIIAGIVVVLLAIGAYGLWSMNTWSAYKTVYENWQKELRTSITTAIGLPVATSPERVRKVAAFKNVSNNIEKAQQSLCRTPALISWQRVIDSVRQREAACGRVVSGAEAFGGKMQMTVTYLEKEQALAAAIATALKVSEGKVTEATWDSQVITWQDADKDITKISASEPRFDKVKASALEKVRTVKTAWQELIAAHTAKDKAKYLEAQIKLTTAYESLSSLSTLSVEEVGILSTSLQAEYAQVLGSST